MKKRHLNIAMLASTVFLVLAMTAGAQILVRSKTASLGRPQTLPSIQAARLRWSPTQ
jgi:hypothetical protein